MSQEMTKKELEDLLEQREKELERFKLDLEERVTRVKEREVKVQEDSIKNNSSFLNKYLAIILTTIISVSTILVSFFQIQGESVRKKYELEMTSKSIELQDSLRVAEFFIGHSSDMEHKPKFFGRLLFLVFSDKAPAYMDIIAATTSSQQQQQDILEVKNELVYKMRSSYGIYFQINDKSDISIIKSVKSDLIDNGYVNTYGPEVIEMTSSFSSTGDIRYYSEEDENTAKIIKAFIDQRLNSSGYSDISLKPIYLGQKYGVKKNTFEVWIPKLKQTIILNKFLN